MVLALISISFMAIEDSADEPATEIKEGAKA